jgi:hypothetical protein
VRLIIGSEIIWHIPSELLPYSMTQPIPNIRQMILEIVQEATIKNPNIPQELQNLVLDQSAIINRIKVHLNTKDGYQEVIAVWYDLFRQGILSYGHDLMNYDQGYFHVTNRGKRVIEQIKRDPANKDGYLEYLNLRAKLNPIAMSYITEALDTYAASCFKATAVMTGAASESLILELRDVLKDRLNALGILPVPKGLDDNKVLTIKKAIDQVLEQHKNKMGKTLKESFEARWNAYFEQIRFARNEGGHPKSVDPISEDDAHANLLIFPGLAELATQLRDWINNDLK